MKKYCEILNEETGLVRLGAGCTDEYYKTIGMKEREVEQSDLDYQWYLKSKCPHKSEKQKKQEEEYRISMLNMTKLDFYKKVLQPNGIDYDKLQQILHTSDEMNASWQLCSRVYRGDKILIGAVKKFIPSITDEELTKIFENK